MWEVIKNAASNFKVKMVEKFTNVYYPDTIT